MGQINKTAILLTLGSLTLLAGCGNWFDKLRTATCINSARRLCKVSVGSDSLVLEVDYQNQESEVSYLHDEADCKAKQASYVPSSIDLLRCYMDNSNANVTSDQQGGKYLCSEGGNQLSFDPSTNQATATGASNPTNPGPVTCDLVASPSTTNH